MNLQEQINADFLQAYKNKDEKLVMTLRMIKSSLVNKMIEKKMAKEEMLEDSEIIAVIKSEIKKRKDSIESYSQGNRNDLAEKEQEEINILEKYLPEQMSEDRIREEIKKILQDKNFTSSDFGKAMGAVMASISGQADGQIVSIILKEELSK